MLCGGTVCGGGYGLNLSVWQRLQHLLHSAQHRGETHQVPQLWKLLPDIRDERLDYGPWWRDCPSGQVFRSPPPCPQPGHYSRGDNFIDAKSDHVVFPFRIHVYEIYNPGGLASILAGDWLFNIICSMFVNKCQHCYEFFF